MNAFLQEMAGQPAALLATAAEFSAAGAARRAAQMWESGAFSRIILTGMGSSDFIAGSGAALLQGVGLSATAVNAGELLHYGAFPEDVLWICISQSGESYEIVQLLPHLGRVIAITNEEDSTLGRRADVLLLTRAGKEEMTSTKTFVTSWQAMVTLADEFGGRSRQRDWNAVAEAVEGALRLDVSPAIDLIGNAPFMQVVGRGPAIAAARQSALMWMEAAGMPASAMCGGNFRHGPLEMVRNGLAVTVLSHSTGATWTQSLNLARDILRYGGKVVMVSDRPAGIHSENLCNFIVPCPEEVLCPVTTVIPVQRMVNDWAEARGMTPGSFSHGAKVTVTE